jgi:hypothetical protein
MRLGEAYLSPWPLVLLPPSLLALRRSPAEQSIAIPRSLRWKMTSWWGLPMDSIRRAGCSMPLTAQTLGSWIVAGGYFQ